MRFLNPELFLLLIPLAVLWLASYRRHRFAAVAYPNADALKSLPPTLAVRLRRGLPLLRGAAVVLVVIALARPQWNVETTQIFREGIAIGLVVDISSSMGALDLKIDEDTSNRLEVAKHTIRAFVSGGNTLAGRGGDLISMVTFARFADTVGSLTADHQALLTLADDVTLAFLPEEDGTAIGEAVVVGIDSLREARDSSRVLILLTDGSNNAGDISPTRAAQIARALGIRVYTIGAGTRGTAMMPARRRDGSIEMRPSPVYIDEYSLERMAQITGGKYYRATDAQALEQIYAQIDELEKGRHVVEHRQQFAEVFTVVALMALLLLGAEVLLASTRLRTVS